MSKSLDLLVREMLDREAIRELPHRYCQCLWLGDADGYASLFTDDGGFFLPPPAPPVVGHESLRRYIRGAMAETMPRPFVHNHVVRLIDDESATGWSSVEMRSGRQNLEWRLAACHDDVYQKVDGTWKFKSRTVRPAVEPS